jgi:uncharacterized protein (TIGR03032 family)
LRDGVLIDIESNQIIAEGLSLPHSPRAAEDFIYFLEAGRGALVRMDRKTAKREDVSFCPGFARGLAIVGHHAVVTISMSRGAAFEGLPVAKLMKEREAPPWRGVLIVNLRNGDIAEELQLEGAVKELFDVEAISCVRCPRGLGPLSMVLNGTIRSEPIVWP